MKMYATTQPVEKYLNVKLECGCGRTHYAPIKAVDIRRGAINALPEYMHRFGYARPYILCDATTYKIAGERCAGVLREAGAEVLGVASIFTYGMQKGLDRLAAANVKNHSLTNFDVIADVAAKQNYIHPDDVARLIQFRNNPSDESWIGGKN